MDVLFRSIGWQFDVNYLNTLAKNFAKDFREIAIYSPFILDKTLTIYKLELGAHVLSAGNMAMGYKSLGWFRNTFRCAIRNDSSRIKVWH